MKPILEIQHISKKFRIHHEKQSYLSMRDSIINTIKSPFKSSKTSSDEDFYALKDITFNVMPGESIGIIGKNGAGKSTLLKILSKITPPTSGKIISRGRIASLLEVGTGFHPELSGRENIFMNGSILGMRKKEIQKNFDAIVDFAGVERFIDTPLKHYSSGMQLRLAFAVAAFLENEILVIDEVLAVGDAEFQKKCISKMEDVGKNGRTVLFVSHNISAVRQLCSKSVLLQNGNLSIYDLSEVVIDKYLGNHLTNPAKIIIKNKNLGFNGFFEIKSICLVNNINDSFIAEWDQPLIFDIIIKSNTILKGLSVGIGMQTNENIPLFTVRSDDSEHFYNFDVDQEHLIRATIKHSLRAGEYNILLGINKGAQSYYYNDHIASIEISPTGKKNYRYKNFGLINFESEWA